MRGMRALGFKGANFTIPHKVAVIPLLDELAPAAQLMQAVNCVNRVGDKLIGENTDGKGFLQSLREVCDPTGAVVAILGAGGAARAIAVELALAGAAKITIVNRSAERGQALVELLKEKTRCQAEAAPLAGDYVVPSDVSLLINATSIGLGNG